jgi:hypothetical protein
MPRMGFELTIPAFERAKTAQTSECAVTVIGWKKSLHTFKHLNEIKI